MKSMKQQMTAFSEFLEDKVDGCMLTDKRDGKICSSECARREREALGASLLMGPPRDWAQDR